MHAFDYARPATLEEALAALAADEDAAPLSGGMTLIPTLKQRLAQPSLLVDLSAIPGLRGIGIAEGEVRIGAMTRHAEVAGDPGLRAAIPGLAALAGMIGDRQVRNRGTIGGSVANNDPAADYPAACLALDAVIVTDRREIPAGDFFEGLFATALEEGELLVALRFPIPARMAYAKFPNPASRYAMAGVCIAETVAGVRVAVTGAGADGVFRWEEAEAALAGGLRAGALDGAAPDEGLMAADIHAAADYRAALVGEMARRALADCLG